MGELHLNTAIDSRLRFIGFLIKLYKNSPKEYATLVSHLSSAHVQHLQELDLESQNFIRELLGEDDNGCY